MQRFRHSVALFAAGILTAAFAAFAGHRSGASIQQGCCPVLELRQYTLKPGQRDAFIALFDRHFVESQEAVGMTIVGQFRDRRRSDRFVWIRGFSDMQSRHTALERFYGGPVWAEHKVTANSTMLDVDDVRLLKPAQSDSAFRLRVTHRPAVGEDRAAAIVVVGIHRLRQAADATVVSGFEGRAIPLLRHEGVQVESFFVTESSPNTFTRLPVREGEQLLVWFGTLQRENLPATHLLQEISAAMGSPADAPLEILELDPTPRSLFGHHPAAR
jgi:hypothetical protein